MQAPLATQYPIIQAPMAGVQDFRLAAAISNAGGLGSLPAAMLNTEQLEQALLALSEATDNSYNVNFFSHTQPTVQPEQITRWHEALAPHFAKFNIDPSTLTGGASRQPFNEAAAEVLERFKPAYVSFHFGLPDKALLERVKRCGSVVISSATSTAEAIWLEQNGADIIIAQGLEAGGHRGHFLDRQVEHQMGTFALLPQVVAAVSCPVVAAGGIADSKGINAALTLGACAVQLGTTFLLCDEATTSPLHRAALQSEEANHTALTNLFSGGAARGIVNGVMRDLGAMNGAAPPFPLASTAITALRQAAEAQDNSDYSPLWCGQNRSGCQSIPAAELLYKLCQDI